jgi:transcriptional antiterminator RfaH
MRGSAAQTAAAISVASAQARWYLIQCRAQQDVRALDNLERQHFECYRPLYKRECIRRGRRVAIHAPLFPGYLFIRLDRLHDNWLPICSTRGVFQIVRFNEYPLPVPDEIIDELRGRADAQSVREPFLKSGEHVLITDGSFAGLEGIFLSTAGEDRVVLLLKILQREQALTFPVGSIRKLRSDASLEYQKDKTPNVSGDGSRRRREGTRR